MILWAKCRQRNGWPPRFSNPRMAVACYRRDLRPNLKHCKHHSLDCCARLVAALKGKSTPTAQHILLESCNEVLPRRVQQTWFATSRRHEILGNIETYCVHPACITSASVRSNEGSEHEAIIHRRNFVDDSHCRGERSGISSRAAGRATDPTGRWRRSGPATCTQPAAVAWRVLARSASGRPDDGLWRWPTDAALRTSRRLLPWAEPCP